MFARPRAVSNLDECDFYHCMDLPSTGEVVGPWDLRPGVDAYLGNIDLADQRVLEIGPASGFLTFHMEQRGAQVVAVEVAEDFGWDFVPFPGFEAAGVFESHRAALRKMKNGFWFAHREFGSSSRLHYGSAYDLPAALGTFDVAVMAAVLLHNRSPLSIIENCASVSKTLVITDLYRRELAETPVNVLIPSTSNSVWDTWWSLSPALIIQFLEVLGFSQIRLGHHTQLRRGDPDIGGSTSLAEVEPLPFFTIVASR